MQILWVLVGVKGSNQPARGKGAESRIVNVHTVTATTGWSDTVTL